MSMPQDNPFKKSDDAPVYGDAPPQRSSKTGWLIGCGVVGLLGMLICCGGAAYFISRAPSFLAGAVNAAMAEQLRGQLVVDPSVQEHIGEIQSLEFDFAKTIENAQRASEAGEEPQLAFRVNGTNGSGVVLIVQDPSGPNGAGIKSGKLVMDDGTEYPLDIGAIKNAPPGNLEINLDDVIDDGQSESTDGNAVEIGPIEVNGGVQDGAGVDNSDR